MRLVDRRNHAARDVLLREVACSGKMVDDKRPELVEVQLLDVERVAVVREVGIRDLVRRRHDEKTAGPQHAAHLRQHLAVLGNVLQHLERDDDVDRLRRHRQRRRAAFRIAQVRRLRSVAGARVGYGVRREVDADDRRSAAGGEQMRPVALATAEVEHHLARGQRLREHIPRQVLVGDAGPTLVRDVALTRKFHRRESPNVGPGRGSQGARRGRTEKGIRRTMIASNRRKGEKAPRPRGGALRRSSSTPRCARHGRTTPRPPARSVTRRSRRSPNATASRPIFPMHRLRPDSPRC